MALSFIIPGLTKVDGRRIETIEVRKQSPNPDPAQTTTKAGD